jgi:NAD(P)-dependent dehydrogenase (short-subunit alcohol dehydrogenase family)
MYTSKERHVDLQLQGKRALITGGSRGIGKAVARQLALEGVDCAICGRTEATIKAAAKELAAETGRKVVPLVADTAKADSITKLVDDTVAALGGLDILVNNAARVGGSAPEDLEHVTDDLILQDFTEKYLGYFRCARAAAPHMRANGWGRIINISGMAARNTGGFSAGPRNASVAHLTKNLSVELGPYGINVAGIYPAGTVTENLLARFTDRAQREGTSVDDLLKQAGASTAIGRIVTAEEIANVATFLCSPLAAGITGEMIPVTGGVGRNVYY